MSKGGGEFAICVRLSQQCIGLGLEGLHGIGTSGETGWRFVESGKMNECVVSVGSPSQQIARTVAWLKQHYAEAVQVEKLAARAHMSPSTFRQRFRDITGVSPLQYQKQLRLQEARQLMLNEDLDASNASGRVGYESASQFSREYSRLFGAPPQRDIRRMRLNQITSS
jgi:AraC-like DNA-binding protein